MESIVIIALFWGGLIFVGWVFEKIGEWNSRRKAKVREEVAREVFSSASINVNLFESYRKKLQEIIPENNEEASSFYKDILSGGRKTYANLLGKCSKCNNGYLRIVKGRYGNFIGCSSYPTCTYTTNINTAKDKYSNKVRKEFIADLAKAYS